MKKLIIAIVFALTIPTTAHALVVKSGQTINLTWQANTEADLQEYEVQRADSVMGPWSKFATVTSNGHVVQTLDLPEGDTVFALIAVDDVGNRSERSLPSEIIRNDNTPPSQPATITITVVVE